MKYKFAALWCTVLTVLLLSGAVSCNVTKDKQDQSSQNTTQTGTDTKIAGNGSGKDVDYEDFKNMSLEERWRSFSPERRNSLRENPDLYPYYKPFIAAEPNMEPEGTITHDNNTLPYTIDSDSPGKPKTTEEWWNSFSEERKTFMRQNPESYPDFVPFFDK